MRYVVSYSISYDGIVEVEAEDGDDALDKFYLLGDGRLLELANKEEPTVEAEVTGERTG